MVQYLSSLSLSRTKTSFLDLGTGNGELLFRLRDEADFHGPMFGVDYSPQSIDLCKGKPSDVEFRVWDIMGDQALGIQADVVLDKGTFDAISLCNKVDAAGRRICEGYRERVQRLVKPGGIFLIASCNWTEPELEQWFSGLSKVGRIEFPVFKFGGQIGQSVCSVMFRTANR